jgi:hypothetical protein
MQTRIAVALDENLIRGFHLRRRSFDDPAGVRNLGRPGEQVSVQHGFESRFCADRIASRTASV